MTKNTGKPPKSLNIRQRRFTELVACGRPAGRAYEEAGYSAQGKSADEAASVLLKKPQVSKVVEELQRQQSKDGYLTRQDIRRKRWELVNRSETPDAVKAKLLADEARMMGFDKPERHQVEMLVVIGGNADE